ncbi:hypothetical protein ACERNI_08505 [Camelimonas sp. ID_303_24]
MIIAILALRATAFVGRAAAELAALTLFVASIALWGGIAAGAL